MVLLNYYMKFVVMMTICATRVKYKYSTISSWCLNIQSAKTRRPEFGGFCELCDTKDDPWYIYCDAVLAIVAQLRAGTVLPVGNYEKALSTDCMSL
jgi:hypothetical protein